MSIKIPNLHDFIGKTFIVKQMPEGKLNHNKFNYLGKGIKFKITGIKGNDVSYHRLLTVKSHWKYGQRN